MLELVKSVVSEILQSSDSAVLAGIREESDPLRKDHKTKVLVVEGCALERVKAELARRLGLETVKIGNARSVTIEELAGRINTYNSFE